jgi:membrane-associated protease RseP (regulator of RpoE activity)
MALDFEAVETSSASTDQLVTLGQLRRRLASVMRIDEHQIVGQPDRVIVFRGELVEGPEETFVRVTEAFESYGYTAWLREGKDGGHEIVATKGVTKARPPRPWLNLVLFVATVLTVLYVGAGYALADLDAAASLTPSEASRLALTNLHRGIPFAATLMGILLAHELSHYFMGRRYGAPVSLPYFIPMPMSILGTMGALIVQRAPMRSRKAVFDIGVAGPIGGLVVAIPLLLYGLSLSTVAGTPAGVAYTQEGNSLLYMALKYLVFGQILPSNGLDVWLHPVAFAAWAGLLVTMINLLPVGQLDGGHVSYALLGRRSAVVGTIATIGMLAWGGWLTLQGNVDGGGFWLLWGFLNLALNRRHAPALDDATQAGFTRVAVGLVVAVLFVLMFMPSPLQIVLPTSGVSL